MHLYLTVFSFTMLLTCSAIYFLIVIGALQSFRDGDDVTETGNSYYTCVEK